MNKNCGMRKDQSLESALTGTVPRDLQEHLLACASCAEEFRALQDRRQRLDALLPLVAQEADPSREFHARVLAAADATRRVSPWRAFVWPRATSGKLAAAAVPALALAALLLFLTLRPNVTPSLPDPDLALAQKLAEWRAPSDSFLQTPGNELLRTTPTLGDSFWPLAQPLKSAQENSPKKNHKEQ
jgi:hypothetical protein